MSFEQNAKKLNTAHLLIIECSVPNGIAISPGGTNSKIRKLAANLDNLNLYVISGLNCLTDFQVCLAVNFNIFCWLNIDQSGHLDQAIQLSSCFKLSYPRRLLKHEVN